MFDDCWTYPKEKINELIQEAKDSFGSVANLNYVEGDDGIIQFKDGDNNLYASSDIVVVVDPFETKDATKCEVHESDNWLIVNKNARIVMFSMRFNMKASTDGNLSVMQFKTSCKKYLPSVYNNAGNGYVGYANLTWSKNAGLLIFISKNFTDIGVSAGATANTGYICQGMYFI